MKQAIEWAAVIDQYKASGLTQQEFCNAHQLSYHRFKYHWYRQKRMSNATPAIKPNANPHAFEVINVTGASSSEHSETRAVELCIHLPNQIRVDVNIDISGNQFMNLLQQLVVLC